MDEQNQEQQAPQAPEAPKSNSANDDKLWAVLSYLGVLCLIPLLGKKESSFVQFHARQGVVLLAGWILSFLPFGWVIGIISFVLSIMGIINVLSGKTEKLPIIGDFADKVKI